MIHQSTFDFLTALKKNNSKEWFDKNRPAYEDAKGEVISIVTDLIQSLAKFDAPIASLEPKKCLFRINRDIRFSHDKSPYKNNIGASMSPGGKKAETAGYYIHIQPGGSFLAGGMWQPPAPELAAIRQEIDYNAPEFKKIIGNKDFKKYFGALSTEDALKTAPKGYEKTHSEIQSLKLRSFVMVHNLSNKDVLSPGFAKHCATVFKAMHPLNVFLRRACD